MQRIAPSFIQLQTTVMKNMIRLSVLVLTLTLLNLSLPAANSGLDTSLGNLYLTSKAKSRSISPENFTGEKGKAGCWRSTRRRNYAKIL